MHKCPKCGREFEGKFCPECGNPWQDKKTCPSCGATLEGSVKFCPECGYSFCSPQKENAFLAAGKKALGWAKAHLKLVVPIAAALVVVIVLLSLIPTFIAMQTNGTYYAYYDGEYYENKYITMSFGKWTDGEEEGTYTIENGTVKFYIDASEWGEFGELFGADASGKIELFSGTVANGVLAITEEGFTSYYVTKNHRHQYGAWTTVREADCTVDGVLERSCACGLTETQPIPATGHAFGEWTVTVEPTCEEEGEREHTCTTCGLSETESIPATGHAFGDWTVTIEPTCEEEGEREHTCTTCGLTETEVLSALGHEFTTENVCVRYEACGTVWEYTEGLAFSEIIRNNEVVAYSVTGIGDVTDSDIVIPYGYNGKFVTWIGDYAFRSCTGLTSVTIGSGVTYIGNYAFYGCKGLTSIVIPDSVTSIGENAFDGCSSLTSVTIGSGVTWIGNYAFGSCTGLKSVYITDIAAWCGISFRSINSNPLYYAYNLYLNGTLVSEFVVPDGVTSIGYYAFSGCSSLTSVVIPDSVTEIGDGAFYNCSSLTSVTIPDGVNYIGDYAFYNCRSLTSVTIPDSVTSIGSRVFSGCTRLTSVTFENTSGWFVFISSSATSGTSVDVSDPATAAEYLRSTYYRYYWKRK